MDGDPNDHFHRNEAISAVVDEGFLGEDDDDDDYEDLYNDVNVGEGFHQSVRKDEDLGFKNQDQVENKLEPVEQPVHDGGERKYESNDGGGGGSSKVEVDSNVRVGVNEALGRASGGAVGSDSNIRVELGQASIKAGEVGRGPLNNENGMLNVGMGQQQVHYVGTGNTGNLGNAGGDGLAAQGSGNVNGFGNGGGGGAGGGTILFVGDLHWCTTDAELESELCKYGHVKEVKFFDEKASGKSKGYCQVEFYDPSAAIACKEGMNGHVFNGRPCVVAFASPFSVKRMGKAQINRNQQMAQAQSSAAQAKRGPGDLPAKPGGNNMPAGGNFQGDNNRGYGRGNWGRGNCQGMAGRGRGGGMGGRGGMGGLGMMGNGFGPLPMMHPQSMMGQGFDPSFGGPMGRMGSYGGFPGGPTPPFAGMLPSFPPVPGLAPHVNPAFFGRGMPMNGMGMMPTSGADGSNMGMWPDLNTAGWAGDEQGGRVGESSYGEEATSDQQYGEGTSDRRLGDDRDHEHGYERDLPREKEAVHEDEWSESWMELTSRMKMATFQTFWIQL